MKREIVRKDFDTRERTEMELRIEESSRGGNNSYQSKNCNTETDFIQDTAERYGASILKEKETSLSAV